MTVSGFWDDHGANNYSGSNKSWGHNGSWEGLE